MFKIFRETITSVKDKTYGQVILGKSLGSSLWYWTLYLLILKVLPLIFFIFVYTYYLPQFQKLVRDHFPSGEISLSSGELSTTLPLPITFKDSSSIFVFDTNASTSALDSYPAGILVSSKAATIKSPDGSSSVYTYPSKLSFSFNKQSLLDWITSHQWQLWFIGAGIIFVYSLFNFAFFWLLGVVLALTAAASLIFISRRYHQSLPFSSLLKISLHASVPPLLVSATLSFLSPPLFLVVNLALFYYLTIGWLSHLPKKNP